MDPLIVCIMPTCNRETVALRAVKSFQAQDYKRAELFVLNQGGNYGAFYGDRVVEISASLYKGQSVGFLRNRLIEGNWGLGPIPDYISHFDDDDVSAPDRLSLQLAHIQKTGKLVTGFYEMPMHDDKTGVTWVYSNEDHRYALGTSLFYRREAWERVKFPDATPEDNKWRKDVGLYNCESQSGFRADGSPIMVQTVHGGNASARIYASSHRYKHATEEQSRIVREMLNGPAVRNL